MPPAGTPSRVDAPQVHRAGIDDAHPGQAGRGERHQVLVGDAAVVVDRRVQQGVGPLGEHRAPTLEVALGGLGRRCTRSGRCGCGRWRRRPRCRPSACSAISAGSMGTFGFCARVVNPLIATSMITGAPSTGAVSAMAFLPVPGLFVPHRGDVGRGQPVASRNRPSGRRPAYGTRLPGDRSVAGAAGDPTQSW